MSVTYIGVARPGTSASSRPQLLAEWRSESARPPKEWEIDNLLAKVITSVKNDSSYPEERPLHYVSVRTDVAASTVIYMCSVSDPTTSAALCQGLLDAVHRCLVQKTEIHWKLRGGGRMELQENMIADLAAIAKQYDEQMQTQPKTKVDKLRAQVAEVRQVMQDNVERVLQRGDRLEDLQDRTNDLEAASNQFRGSAVRVRQQMCWKNMKWNIIVAVIATFLLLTIILVMLYEFGVIGKKQ